MSFNSSLHPRAQGGKFSVTVGGVRLPASIGRLYQKFGLANNTLSYDPKTNRGTGYGLPGGDARVSFVQRLLNRLGFRDRNGAKLQVDGRDGPLTTSAVQAAQRALGMKPDGKVTPALAARLIAMPKPKATHAHRSARSLMGRGARHGI